MAGSSSRRSSQSRNEFEFDKYGDQAEAVMHELARSVRGEVRFDPASRSLYASDLSVYRHVPIGVVVPREAKPSVIATVGLLPQASGADSGPWLRNKPGGTMLQRGGGD